MDEAEKHWAAEIHFNISEHYLEKDVLVRLRNVTKRHPGDCNGFIHLKLSDDVETVIAMSDDWRIQPGKSLTREVVSFLGRGSVETTCTTIPAAVTNETRRTRARFNGA
jgi:hypothetical protein